MLKRILTAIIGVSAMLPFVIFSHTVAIVVLTSGLVIVAVYELLKCIGKEKNIFLLTLSEMVAISAQVLAWIISDDNTYLATLMLISIVYVVLVLSGAVFTAGRADTSKSAENSEATKVRASFDQSVTAAVMTLYVSFGFSSLILLRDMKQGLISLLLWFIIPWVCDAMAYFCGRAFGKHKLIPTVSPKKTVEGAIGGVIGTLIITLIFALVAQFGFGQQPNYPALLGVTLIGCPISMCGDLIASLLKREYNIKDYGKLFPGHGGVMDRFDSCISTGPFIYIVCAVFSSNALFY